MKRVIVIGLGTFGLSILDRLMEIKAKYSVDPLGLDFDEKVIHRLKGTYSNSVTVADSTNEKELRNLDIKEDCYAIICFGDSLEKTILTITALQSIGVRHITVRCDQEKYFPLIQKLGIEDIVSPQSFAGERIATRVAYDSVDDFFNITSEYSLCEVKAPSTFKEIDIISLDARNKFGVNLILVKRDGHSFSPNAKTVIQANDALYVCGKDQDIIDFGQYLKK